MFAIVGPPEPSGGGGQLLEAISVEIVQTRVTEARDTGPTDAMAAASGPLAPEGDQSQPTELARAELRKVEPDRPKALEADKPNMRVVADEPAPTRPSLSRRKSRRWRRRNRRRPRHLKRKPKAASLRSPSKATSRRRRARRRARRHAEICHAGARRSGAQQAQWARSARHRHHHLRHYRLRGWCASRGWRIRAAAPRSTRPRSRPCRAHHSRFLRKG